MNKHSEQELAMKVLNYVRQMDLQVLCMATLEEEKYLRKQIEFFKDDEELKMKYSKKLKKLTKNQNLLYDIRVFMSND